MGCCNKFITVAGGGGSGGGGPFTVQHDTPTPGDVTITDTASGNSFVIDHGLLTLPGGANIYDADGTLAGTRVVDMGGQTITWNNGGPFIIDGKLTVTGLIDPTGLQFSGPQPDAGMPPETIFVTDGTASGAPAGVIVFKDSAGTYHDLEANGSGLIDGGVTAANIGSPPANPDTKWGYDETSGDLYYLDGAGLIQAVPNPASLGNAPATGQIDATPLGLDLIIPPGDALAINGTVGGAGQVLTSNGSGNPPSWQDPTVDGVLSTAAVNGANIEYGLTVGGPVLLPVQDVAQQISPTDLALTDTGGFFAVDNVEAALQQIGSAIAAGSDGVLSSAAVNGANIEYGLTVGGPVTIPITDIAQQVVAADLAIVDAGGFYVQDNVEGALSEIQVSLAGLSGDSHQPVSIGVAPTGVTINPTTQVLSVALVAADIGYTPTAPITGTDVGAALDQITTQLTGIAHTAITNIDLQPTVNPNEYTVVIQWTDENGTPQTTTDPTPIVISGATSGIDDVLAVGQTLTANRSIDIAAERLNINGTSGVFTNDSFFQSSGVQLASFANGAPIQRSQLLLTPNSGVVLTSTSSAGQTCELTTNSGRIGMDFHPNADLEINGNTGLTGEVLTSQGVNSPPIWAAPATATPGIDDVLAVNQGLTANRAIALFGNTLQFFAGDVEFDMTGVNDDLRILDGNQAAGFVLTSDAAGNATWQAAPAGGVGIEDVLTFDNKIVGDATIDGQTLYAFRFEDLTSFAVDATGSLTLTNGGLATIQNGTGLVVRGPGTFVTSNAGATTAPFMRFFEAQVNGGNYIQLKAPDNLAGNVGLTLPSSDGNPGESLLTDGNGVMSWGSPLAAGIDDVLAIGQGLTADRAIALFGNAFEVFDTNTYFRTRDGRIEMHNNAGGGSPNGAGIEIFDGNVEIRGNGTNNIGGASSRISVFYNSSISAPGPHFIDIEADQVRFDGRSGGPEAEFWFISNGGGHVALQAPTGMSSANNYTIRWPGAQGAAGQGLVNDGAGNLSWGVPSDERVKSNVAPITDALDVVAALDGKRFNYAGEDDRPRFGLIAQQVARVAPEAVDINPGTFGDESFDNLHSVDYDGLVGLLVSAVNELSARVAELESNQ